MNHEISPNSNGCDPDRLSAEVDGELTPRESAELANHLATCTRCRETLASLKRISQSIQSLPSEAMPSEVLMSVRQSAVRYATPSPALVVYHPRRYLRMALATAASLLIGIVLWRTIPYTGDAGQFDSVHVMAVSDQEIAGIDFAISLEESGFILSSAGVTETTEGFLMASSSDGKTLRVSMASVEGIAFEGGMPILRMMGGDRYTNQDLARLSVREVRAYRPDGSPASIQLQTVPAPTS